MVQGEALVPCIGLTQIELQTPNEERVTTVELHRGIQFVYMELTTYNTGQDVAQLARDPETDFVFINSPRRSEVPILGSHLRSKITRTIS